MLATLWCWLIFLMLLAESLFGEFYLYVGYFIIFLSMYLMGHQHPASVTNILHRSPTSKTCHQLTWSDISYQHQCNQNLTCEPKTWRLMIKNNFIFRIFSHERLFIYTVLHQNRNNWKWIFKTNYCTSFHCSSCHWIVRASLWQVNLDPSIKY